MMPGRPSHAPACAGTSLEPSSRGTRGKVRTVTHVFVYKIKFVGDRANLGLPEAGARS